MTSVQAEEAPEQVAAFEGLLEYLKQTRSFDFGGYKRSSLMRRVHKRVEAVGVEDYGAYQDFLEVHPDEFTTLFDTVLINFTGFFRDRDAWEFLAESVIPRMLNSSVSNRPLRVWSAGCASGQEAYTILMVLAEALGAEACRERVKIYGTDLDESALTQARQATYDARAIQEVPEALREKYFEKANGAYVFRNDLRRILVFGRHDLIQDAPISHLDLLVCRNTLIYFNRDAQKHIITNFQFALRDTGYLFLGRAEMLLAQDNAFVPYSMQHRIFRKVDLASSDDVVGVAQATPAGTDGHVARERAVMLDAAFETSPVAQVVIGAGGDVVVVNERARVMFGLHVSDLGRPFRDLELSYRPVELRSLIDRARQAKHTVSLADVERTAEDASRFYDIEVVPLWSGDDTWLGAALSFAEVTHRHLLELDLQQARHEAETASEELQSTNEELETSNEELQSTVEELQTTNEELQSTNEEMETLNEELQSTNEELHSMNAELRERSRELDTTNAFLNSILKSVDLGVVVIDDDLRVRLWNERAQDLWGLRAEEVRGRSLMRLDIGLPVEALRELLRDVLEHGGGREITLDAVNRRGKTIRVRVVASARDDVDAAVQGIVLLMEEVCSDGAR